MTATNPSPALATAALVAAALSWTSAAQAQVVAGSAEQVVGDGFDLQLMDPAPAGDRFFGVPDGAVGDTQFYAMAFTSVTLNAPLVRTDDVTAQKTDIVKHQWYVHADASWAIRDLLLVNVDIPFIPVQEGDIDGNFAPSGGVFGDPRIGGRLSLAGSRLSPAAFALAADFWLPVGSEDDVAGDGELRANPKAELSGKVGRFVYATNVGYLFRKEREAPVPAGPSLTFGAAVGVLAMDDQLQIGAEAFGRTLLDDAFASDATPAQLLAGGKLRASDWVFGIAGGPGLSEAAGSAPRIVASLAYAPPWEDQTAVIDPEADLDGDGVKNADDICPHDAGVRAKTTTADLGCPEPPSRDCPAGSTAASCPKPDRDGDGVPDVVDACETEPGPSESGGCPPQAQRYEIQVVQASSATVTEGPDRVMVMLNAPTAIEPAVVGTSAQYRLSRAKLTTRTQSAFASFSATQESNLRSVDLKETSDGVILSVGFRGTREPRMRYQQMSPTKVLLIIEIPRPESDEKKK